MKIYAVVTTDGQVVGAFNRRRETEDHAVAVAQNLNETLVIKRLNVFGDGYEETGLEVLPGERRVRRVELARP